MDVHEIERLVVELYERHNFDPAEPVSPWKLARAELGAKAIERPIRLVGGSHAYQVNEKWRIAVSRMLTVEYAAHAVGHELGHAVFAMQGIRFETDADEERAADLFGGALLAPAPAVRAFYRARGMKLRAMAIEAVSTTTWAALRMGEALGIPCAVVTPERIRTRGPSDWVWPDEPTLRKTAWSGRHGVRRPLGKTGRYAFFPDEFAA